MAKDSMEDALQAGMRITIKGREYHLVPATIGDWLALKEYLKGKRIESFIASPAAKALPIEERTRVLVELSSQIIGDAEAMNDAVATDGLIFMLWRSLLHSNPDLKFADMNELLDDQMIGDLSNVVQNLVPAENDLKN